MRFRILLRPHWFIFLSNAHAAVSSLRSFLAVVNRKYLHLRRPRNQIPIVFQNLSTYLPTIQEMSSKSLIETKHRTRKSGYWLLFPKGSKELPHWVTNSLINWLDLHVTYCRYSVLIVPHYNDSILVMKCTVCMCLFSLFMFIYCQISNE